MKTKIIPFDLETAKKIQAGEIEGKIITREGKCEMRIVCYNSTVTYCGIPQPIIAQYVDDSESFYAYSRNGAYMLDSLKHKNDLVLEVPDNEPQFKPFEKVLARDCDSDEWQCDLFSHIQDDTESPYVTVGHMWRRCIPYEGNEQLVGTTNKPKNNEQ